MTQAPTPTADTVRRLVRSLLGGSAEPETVRPVAEGTASATWWVGTRHVLRLAPDREAAVRQRRELRLRELIRPHLSVAVPKSVAHGEWAPGLTYTLDTRVPGGSGEDHDVSALGEADLAALLGGLREVPARQAETLGVPRAAPRPLETLRQAAERAALRLARADEFDAARPERLTRAATAQLGAQSGAAVLVHHALAGEHLVVGADGRVRGVLGWTDAVLGDPAEDIAALALSVGSPAAVRAATLAGYGARPCLRGLWLARCDALVHLAGALPGGPPTPPGVSTRPLPLLRLRLRRAWEPILLERVTELREDGDGDGTDGPDGTVPGSDADDAGTGE